MRRRLCLALLLAQLALLALPTGGWTKDAGTRLDGEVMQLMSHAKSGIPVEDRVADVMRLYKLLEQATPNEKFGLAPATIDQISSLLGDPDDEVRAWTAGALGSIGPPAMRALPSLQKALAEIRKVNERIGFGPTLSSEDPIVDAIGKISGQSPPRRQ